MIKLGVWLLVFGTTVLLSATVLLRLPRSEIRILWVIVGAIVGLGALVAAVIFLALGSLG